MGAKDPQFVPDGNCVAPEGPAQQLDDPGVSRAIPDVAVMVVSYRGDLFHGFAAQPGVPTVAGALKQVIERRCGVDPRLEVAGRTDAGVHATGQVISFPAATLAMRRVPLERLARGINRDLNPAIAVRGWRWEPAPFSARFDAQWRRYRYRLNLDGQVDVLEAHREWSPRYKLDLDAMATAARGLVGQHDFASFCRAGPPGSTTERTILDIAFDPVVGPEPGRRIEVVIRGTAFCWQMVRSIVGTLVDVGRGALHAGDIDGILGARDRGVAGQIAPPQGLVLDSVGYQGWDSAT